jgi:hypothetical protein
MKAELLPDKTLYTIQPLSSEDRTNDILLDHFARKYKDPHILIRSPLRKMLCENTGTRKISDLNNQPYTLPPLITCDYPFDSFELSIGSNRFVHSRLGGAIDTEANIARVGKADAFMEFGKLNATTGNGYPLL